MLSSIQLCEINQTMYKEACWYVCDFTWMND